VQDRMAVLSNDVVAGAGLAASAKSLAGSKITSLIAVPMVSATRLMGVLYLETEDAGVRFDDDHLQLASAIETLGALALENQAQVNLLQKSHHQLVEELRAERSMVGESRSMQQIYDLIAKVGPADSTVLIRGESGTGEELVARAIHWSSSRAEKPFVAI